MFKGRGRERRREGRSRFKGRFKEEGVELRGSSADSRGDKKRG